MSRRHYDDIETFDNFLLYDLDGEQPYALGIKSRNTQKITRIRKPPRRHFDDFCETRVHKTKKRSCYFDESYYLNED